MSVSVKICGLRTLPALQTAIEAGATYIGFVFFDRSPRNITTEQAASLAREIPKPTIKTGVFVNPDNAQLSHILKHVPLDLIQLHGTESPDRLQEIKDLFRIPVMKAITISGPDDLTQAKRYDPIADMLLFDAKATASCKNSLPGGNGISFDWQLLKGIEWQIPWMLSGGLNIGNIQQAIRISGAKIVDISSGIEKHPGEKSLTKIREFMSKVKKS